MQTTLLETSTAPEETLQALLHKLGYARHEGIYRYPDRQAVFLGDFIDRGPRQREVVEIVRPMVEQGSALAVMANHEFNGVLLVPFRQH